MSDPKKPTIPIKNAATNEGAVSQMTECGAAISTASMERFLRTFEASAKRWEMVVYPAMFAFVVLAAYGFFLIYSLATDVNVLARSMDPIMGDNMLTMSKNMNTLTEDIHTMTTEIRRVSNNVEEMQQAVTHMSGDLTTLNTNIADVTTNIDAIAVELQTLTPILNNVAELNSSVKSVSHSTSVMRNDMSHMTHSVARPAGFFNSFMPW